MKCTLIRQIRFYIFAMAAIGCMMSCSSDAPDLPNHGDESGQGESHLTQITLTKSGESLVENVNNLSFRLFNSAIEDMDVPTNLCLSPFSIYSNLAILTNGASEDTRINMLEMFGMNSASDENLKDLNGYYAELLTKLPKVDDKVSLNFTNSLWVSPDLKLMDDFSEIFSHDYLGEVVYEAANGESGMAKINSWIENHTNGRITNFLATPLVHPVAVINTLYFSGMWKEDFDSAKSTVAPFHNIGGSESDTKFMNSTRVLHKAENENFVAVDIPFGNESYVLTLVLPKDVRTCKMFNYADWNAIMSNGTHEVVDLSIPKFKAETNIDAMKLIENIFPGNLSATEFSNILHGQNLTLSELLHGISLEIDETGCEAAGTTLASFELASDPNSEIKNTKIEFNRPFYYLLREQTTNLILFIGKINKL